MRGFTLIELIVAIAVAGFVLGASVTTWPKLHQAMEYRSAVRGVFASMNTARSEALRSGQAAVFFVDLDRRSYGVGDKVLGTFSDVLAVRYTLAEREVDARGRGQIRFSPDGGATGGNIEVLRSDGSGVRLRVDWLLGTVTQEAVSG